MRIAPVGGGGRFVSRQCRGGHLATGHAVDAVVDKDSGNVLSPRRSVDNLGAANRR